MIEMVIALALLAFVMTAMASMFYSAANVAVDTKSRTQATGVAVRALESMRVSAYANIGFYSGQTAYSARCDPTDNTAETVTLGAGNPATAQYKPVETVRLPNSGLDFTVARCIVWADVPQASGTPLIDAYKKTMVDISWVDRTGATHHVRQNSIVYPGGFGSYAGAQTHPAGSTGTSTGGSSVPPSAPFDVTVTVPADPLPDNGLRSLDLAWQYTGIGADHFEVQWSDTPSFATVIGQEDTTDGNATSMTVGGLAPFWTYYFRVYAHGDALETSTGPASATAQGTTTAYPGGGCNIGPLTLTTTGTPASSSKVYKLNNGRLGVDLVLTTTLSGPCASTYSVAATGAAPATTQVGTWNFPLSGSSRTVTAVVSNQNWAPGVYTFVVRAGGVDTGSKRTFLVCANSSTQNPSPNAC